MADEEFQLGSQNWTRNSSSTKCSSPSSSTTYARWPAQVADVMKPGLLANDSSNSAVSAPPPYNTNMALFQDSHHPMDWNQSLLTTRSLGKSDDDNSFRTEDHDLNSDTSFQQHQWPRSHKMMMYSSNSEGAAFSSLNQAQLMSSHHHHQLNQHMDHNNFQLDSSSPIQYQNNPSTTTLLPGLLGYEINQPPQEQSTTFDNRSVMESSYNSYSSSSYGINSSSSSDHDHQSLMLQPNPWSSNKPQNQLHLSNNAPFWNASSAVPVTNHAVGSNFFPSLQMQSPSSTFDEKPKKSSSSETSSKRPRNETTASPLAPANKVRKEKMGDRITALQQLVSPFGKTDTASVLSEAIEYIKFLHEQVSVLSNAYMKNGAPIQQKQKSDDHKPKDGEGVKQDLRSKGLCLVPVSSTFPVNLQETTVDFWNPTFGGTFR